MRIPRTLAHYALREALTFSALGLLGVGGIVLTQNLLKQLSDVTEVSLSPSDVARLLGCLAGIVGPYTLPVAFLFGVVATISRLSADAEILAMRSLGVSLAQLTTPFLGLALVTSVATFWLLGEVEPSSRRQLRAVAGDIAARGELIQPGRFSRLDREGKRLLLVEEREENGTLSGVFLTDRTDPKRAFTVVAARGRFEFDRESAEARIELLDGNIHIEDRAQPSDGEAADQEERHIRFGEFRYAWDMGNFLSVGLDRARAREFTNAQLRGVLAHFDEHGEAPAWARRKDRWRYELQLQRRAALAAAPLIFAALGVTLGLRRSRGASSWGALVCAVLVFIYYSLLSFGTDLVSSGSLPASAGMWLPNAIFALVAAGLLWWARRVEV